VSSALVSRRAARALALPLVALLVVLAAAAAAQAARPLRTAVFQPSLLPGAAAVTELDRIRAAGATLVRLSVVWPQIAPSTKAEAFHAADPADPAYAWDELDAQVKAATRKGLQPILNVVGAPEWARSDSTAGAGNPQPALLAGFARAVAQRYSGSTPGLPRVRYWQLWNEPNLNTNLTPQFNGLTPVSPGIYRGMVNAFAKAVKGVSASNVVIVGALAPYGIEKKGQPIDKVLSVAPLRFMRDLLCISGGAHPRATCGTKVAFDAFAIHPYTWGSPTHSAFSADDVAMGDLPEVKALLASAWKLHRIQARSAPALWVTEISWDTNPPDPNAVPIATQTRWTSEALYRMWTVGVAVITWFQIRDETTGPFQSGLYFAGPTVGADRAKPTLRAFRFPFVAFPQSRGTLVWGRVPASNAAAVVIEQKVASRWRQVARLRSNGVGIFEGRLTLPTTTGWLRARLATGTERSLPFGLKPVPDVRVSPFGT
jgi:hypothetical protein